MGRYPCKRTPASTVTALSDLLKKTALRLFGAGGTAISLFLLSLLTVLLTVNSARSLF